MDARLDDLEAFVQVARAGGFSAAARVNGLPLSTLSRRIARLEAALGTPLLRRTSRRVALTEAGTALLARAGDTTLAAARALREGQGEAAVPSGRLRVSCPAWTARRHYASTFAAFAAAHPAVQLELVLTNSALDLVEHDIDVAIRGGPIADGALRSRVLGESAFGVFRRHAGTRRRTAATLSVAELEAHPAVVTPPLDTWAFLNAAGRTRRVRPRRALAVNDLELATVLASQNPVVAYLPTPIGEEAGLELVEVEGLSRLPRPLHALWAATPVTPPRVRALVDALVADGAMGER